MIYKNLKKDFPRAEHSKTPFYVSVAGNIGVGKSMITTMIGEIFNWRMFYEPVIKNPYLDDYYKDMKRWSFHLQVYFLSKRFEVQKLILDHKGSAVQDRTIYEDVEIFAPTLHRRGCMDDRDYENYREVFHNMVSFLRPPDLVLYLRAGVDASMSRIAERGRDCESDIPRDFIQDLYDAYEEWIGRAGEICPVRIVDTETVNLRDDPAAQRELLDHVAELHERKRKAMAAGGGA